MDAWMQAPGARVVGHRARVRTGDEGAVVTCDCGFTSLAAATVDSACLVLVAHLQGVVRLGARVTYGDEGGPAGVREPRRPLHPFGSVSAAVQNPGATRSA